MSGSRDGAIARALRGFDDGTCLARLRELVAVPTESQLPDSLPALTRYRAETMPALMQGMGFETMVLDNPRAGRGPVFVAMRIEDPALPTVLVCGHGDVVRGLAPKWSEGLDPWQVTLRGGTWYGRGKVDDKSQHLIAIEALRAVIAERGRLGFNAKVPVETGEGQGSPGLRGIPRGEAPAGVRCLHRARRAAPDHLHAGDQARRARRRGLRPPRASARPRASFRPLGRRADRPGLRARARPGHDRGPQGPIQVEGWTPKDIPAWVKRAIGALVFERIAGLPEADPDWGEPGLTTGEKIFGWTSVIVLAQITGHPDAPTNAVQGEARARLQARHCADVKGADIVPALRRHLDRHGFAEVRIIPVPERDMFGEELDQPVIWIPNSCAGCSQHGADEHALAPLLREGLGLMARPWWDIGEGGTPARR